MAHTGHTHRSLPTKGQWEVAPLPQPQSLEEAGGAWEALGVPSQSPAQHSRREPGVSSAPPFAFPAAFISPLPRLPCPLAAGAAGEEGDKQDQDLGVDTPF